MTLGFMESEALTGLRSLACTVMTVNETVITIATAECRQVGCKCGQGAVSLKYR